MEDCCSYGDPGLCNKPDKTLEEGLQCGCHSKQSDFVGGAVGPCEITELNGTLYVTGNITNTLIEIDRDSGEATHYNSPTRVSLPVGITNDGENVWYTQMLAGQLASFDPSTEKTKEYSIRDSVRGTVGSATTTADGDKIWFTASSGGFFGYLKDGEITKYDLPKDFPGPRGIDVREDDVLIAANRNNALYRHHKHTEELEKIHQFGTGTNPIDVMEKGGVAYVTLGQADKLVGVDIDSGNVVHSTSFPSGSRPSRLAEDNDGRLWTTEILANRIAVIGPEEDTMKQYDVPYYQSAPEGIHELDGDIYFTMWAADRVGRFDTDNESFETYHIPGEPTIFPIVGVIIEIIKDLKGNRSDVHNFMRSPTVVPPSETTLRERMNPSKTLGVYDAIVKGLEVYAETDSDDEAAKATIENLPDRPGPTSGKKAVLGFAGWINVLGTVASMAQYQSTDRVVKYIIQFSKDWMDHDLEN